MSYRGSNWYRSIGGTGMIFGIGIADTLSPDTSIFRYLHFGLFWAQKLTNLDDFWVQLYSFLRCKVIWCVSHWTYQVWHEYGFLTMAPWISSCTIWIFYGILLYKNVGIEVSKYRRYFWQKYRSIEHFIRPILLEPLPCGHYAAANNKVFWPSFPPGVRTTT